jgi:hypothetical protein
MEEAADEEDGAVPKLKEGALPKPLEPPPPKLNDMVGGDDGGSRNEWDGRERDAAGGSNGVTLAVTTR